MLTYGELSGHVEFDCPHCNCPAIIPVSSIDLVERQEHDLEGRLLTFQVPGIQTKCPGCNKSVTITL